jgi:hypothetical protein
VGANVFKDGVNLTKISMPVQLFEKRSFLERLSANWDYLDLLMAAANTADPVDRMKYVVGFAVSGLCRQMGADKPFNPILGETYQGRYPNGVEVFAEQISHHPPISSWEVVDPHGKVRVGQRRRRPPSLTRHADPGPAPDRRPPAATPRPQFVFHGNGNWSAAARGNSIKGRQSGVNRIRFADGSDISYELPGLNLKGGRLQRGRGAACGPDRAASGAARAARARRVDRPRACPTTCLPRRPPGPQASCGATA